MLIKTGHNGPSPLTRAPGVVTLICVLATTFVCFFPVLKSDFTNWDDGNHLLNNPLVADVTPYHVQKIFTTTVSDVYVPLTLLSFAVENHFFGLNPLVYHLDNLILHLAVTGLIFAFARRLGLTVQAAGLAALFFGIHPIHVESVAWVTERKDVLYALFYMLALNSYAGYLSSGRARPYLFNVLFCLLSVLAKPMALSLPLIMWLCDWFLRRRFTAKVAVEKVPHLLIIGGVALMTYVQHMRVPGENIAEGALIWLWTLTFYIQKFIAPLVLVPLYQMPDPIALSNPSYLLAAGIFVLLVAGMVRYRNNRMLVFAVLFYFGSIFFLLRYDTMADIQMVADRFMYLPSLGFCCFLGWALDRGVERFQGQGQRVIFGCIVGLALFLGVKTYLQAGIWKNSVRLWNHVVRYSPEMSIAYSNRSVSYVDLLGNLESAEADYERLYQLKLKMARKYYRKAKAYEREGNIRRALQYYDTALMRDPHYALAYIGRGDFYQKQQKLEPALADYNEAIKILPGDAQLYAVRGNVYKLKGQYDLAIADFTKALEIDPRYVWAYNLRAYTYRKSGDIPSALADLERALALDPSSANTYFERGNLYLEEKDYARAVEDYTRALRINPGYMEVWYNRALSYQRWQRYPFALNDLNRVLEMSHEHLGALLERGRTYAKMGEFDLAILDYNAVVKKNMTFAAARQERSKLFKEKGHLNGAFMDALVARYLDAEIEEGYIEEIKDLIRHRAAAQ